MRRSRIGFFSSSSAASASFSSVAFCCRCSSICFSAFLDLRDPDRDFLLLLLELLERDDFVAQLGKIDRLRDAFAAERDLAFCRTRFSWRNAMRVFWRRTFSPISRNPVRIKLTR